jgi:hypothetical protein
MGGRRRAAHAAAHQVRALDVELVQQPDALPDVVAPADALEASAGPARLAAVEGDAGVPLGEAFEQPEPAVDADGAPALQARVESAR